MIAWARRHGRALDAAFALIFAALLVLPLSKAPAAWQGRPLGERATLAVLFVAPLLLRWRVPRAVFAFLVLATLAAWPLSGAFVGHIVLPFAGYAMAVSVERRVATKITAVALVVLSLPAIWTVRSGDPGAVVEVVVWTALGCALGMAAASQRRYFREARERVRAAEQSREEEAARRVAEERLRISRELHDVIAHYIAVINVQSGVAGHLLGTDLDAAEQALRNVRGAARTVLEELGGVLAVLRQDPGSEDPRAPAPGLAQIPALVNVIQDQGHQVSLKVDGEPYGGLAGVELTAYRVVQEALTNVHKHAPAADIRVGLAWEPHRLIVSVFNDPPPRRPPRSASGSGFGLVGMRERVTAIGGALAAEPLPHGGYLVRADLPIERGRPLERDRPLERSLS